MYIVALRDYVRTLLDTLTSRRYPLSFPRRVFARQVWLSRLANIAVSRVPVVSRSTPKFGASFNKSVNLVP